MLRVVVLGAAAGGGVPQWNCGCDVCNAARSTNPELKSTQSSIAISADGAHWFLVNASPDLRQQVISTPQLYPKHGELRHSPIAGVILTNSEVDAVAGLLTLRESSPFTIYAHPDVLAILAANSIFNVLNEKYVQRRPIVVDQAIELQLPDGSPQESRFYRSSLQASAPGISRASNIRQAKTPKGIRSGCGLPTRRPESISTIWQRVLE